MHRKKAILMSILCKNKIRPHVSGSSTEKCFSIHRCIFMRYVRPHIVIAPNRINKNGFWCIFYSTFMGRTRLLRRLIENFFTKMLIFKKLVFDILDVSRYCIGSFNFTIMCSNDYKNIRRKF